MGLCANRCGPIIDHENWVISGDVWFGPKKTTSLQVVLNMNVEGRTCASNTITKYITFLFNHPISPPIIFIQTQVTKGSVSYLSSPCFSTSLGGIGGPARGIHGILAVMYWISIIRAPPPRKWSWVQFSRVTRSRAPTLEAHFP